MKKNTLFLFIAIMLINLIPSYAQRMDPLMGNYKLNYEKELSQNYDNTWNVLLNLIAENGWQVKKIDKQSGIIELEFLLNRELVTVEDKNYKPKNENAYIVVPTKWNSERVTMFREYEVKYNIFVMAKNDNTIIKIYKIKGDSIVHVKMNPNEFVKAESTGVFERMFLSSINEN